MNPATLHWFDLSFRWAHLIAGIMWVGHLWFFNFVNAEASKTYDADTKKKVVPVIVPRALYFFRFGAIFTFTSGLLLLGTSIYHGGVMTGAAVSPPAAAGIGIGSLFVSFVVYDRLWRSPLGKNPPVAAAVSFVLIVGLAYGYLQVMPPRAAFIHVGAAFGSIMAANVGMRIWPSQRKILAAIAEGKAPDADLVALSTERSRHNTYLSIPVLFFMISNHYPLAYGMTAGGTNVSFLVVGAVVAIGWAIARHLYATAAGERAGKY